MKAVIISSGSINDHVLIRAYIDGAGFIAAADGGTRYARAMSVIPDVILGDQDSGNSYDMDYFREKGSEIIKYPAIKEKTDTELAADHIIERFAGGEETVSVVFLGALGMRYDHSLSNIYLLEKFCDRGIKAAAVDELNEIYLLKGPETAAFNKGRFNRISILPLDSTAEGVNTQGSAYVLKNAKLHPWSSRGISNEFVGNKVEISIKRGRMLVILSVEQ